ncbi:MAG: hypothetical protein EOM28_13450, partial [Clostridia bacterium]|nr:hypothetical protein [Clostridia bacterium]
ELNKRLTGKTESKQNEKEIEMYLIYCTDTKRYYVSNGVSVRYVRSTRMLENYQNKWGKLNLPKDTMLQVELDAEFGPNATKP